MKRPEQLKAAKSENELHDIFRRSVGRFGFFNVTLELTPLSQQQVGGFARQANTFDVCLMLQQDADHVTLQLARHLPTRDYADIIAALQVLFRQVEAFSVTNPTDFDEELRDFLRVMLRPIARLAVDPGFLMAEYQRARIAAIDGEDRVPDF